MRAPSLRAATLAAAAVAAPAAAATEAGRAFDYVVAGGGTCGLALANRLSADAHASVAVVEPGSDVRGNANVTGVARWLDTQGTAVDWQYLSAAQAGAGNRTVVYHAGKAVGGTSAINGMTYIRGDAAEIDAWEALGNDGWNWDALYPYYKQVEHWTPPTAAQVSAGGTYDPEFHGDGGPLDVCFPPELSNGSFYQVARDTWDALGYPKIRDVNGGSVRGFDVWPMTVDRDADVREDAARAYYWPVADRPNLTLIKGTVTRLLWQEETTAHPCGSGGVSASGVEYLDSDGVVRVLEVKKEVILSAGSLRTPPILERSGIGNPRILGKLGIDTVVELPGVGENLQDQPNLSLVYSGKINETGYVPYATFATAQDVFGNSSSTIASTTRSSLSEWAERTASRTGGGLDAGALEKIFQVQHDLIFKRNVTIAEILTTASGDLLVSAFWALLPFSRGGVHLRSTSHDDVDDPVIDPAFFDIAFDLDTQVAIGRLAQAYWAEMPVADLVVENISPGTSVLPLPASDEQWESLVTEAFTPNFHPIGTAAMMARELGGVVDPELRVYGTGNVRVVDASVLPLQISGHLTATLYAVAERASEMIRTTTG